MVRFASLMILGFAWREAMGPTGSDFLAFWGAGEMVAAGDPAAAYDLAMQERVQTATGSQGWFAFVNPPPFLFATAPLGLLPFPIAWPLWVIAARAAIGALVIKPHLAILLPFWLAAGARWRAIFAAAATLLVCWR